MEEGVGGGQGTGTQLSNDRRGRKDGKQDS